LYLFSKTIPITASVAPDTFAKISNGSPVLVVVKNCCNNSIIIPRINENTNEIAKGLKKFELFNFFFKNKNQSDTNTKWKKA
jgi:hypothetical protein